MATLKTFGIGLLVAAWACSAPADWTGPNGLVKGMSVFPLWAPGSGLAGAWALDYDAAGQPVPGTFTALLSEGDGRIVNVDAGDVDGDGTNEVVFAYNWEDTGPNSGFAGFWMVDVVSTGSVAGTFTGIDSFGDNRAVDVAVADLSTGDGNLEVIFAQSFLSGIDSGLWAMNLDSAGTITNFRRIATLNNAYLYSVGAGDVDNDGLTEILVGEHRGTVDGSILAGTEIEVWMYDTDDGGLVEPPISLATYNLPNPEGGWLGLAAGDVDNDGTVEGIYVLNQWADPTNSTVVTVANPDGAGMFEVDPVTASAVNVVPLNLDDFNRRTDPGTLGDDSLSQTFVGGISAGRGLEFSFNTLTGRTYQPQYSDDLVSGAWTDLGVPITGDGGPLPAFDARQQPQRAYRVIQQD